MDILAQIVNRKRERVEEAKRLHPLEGLRTAAVELRENATAHALNRALRHDGVNIIAEFKRRSPSKGSIREGAEVAKMASSYQAGGAVALSVLTEEDYFEGSLTDLRTAKASVDLPVLRKDFLFDEYQVYEAAAAGADAILLIVATLADRQLESLRRLAEEDLGLDALVEAHSAPEMVRAVNCGATIIGINNRDLRTFVVSLDVSLELAGFAPPGTLLVSESGLNQGADLRRLREQGFSGFLIGESLMRAEDPEVALRDLLNDAR